MSANQIGVTEGSGKNVATETVGTVDYGIVEVTGKGGASILAVNPDGSFKASIIGTPTVTFSGSPSISGAVTIIGTPSISGAVTVVGNPSISGTVNIGIIPGSVVSFQGGTQITSLVSTIPSSVIVGASIFGTAPVTQSGAWSASIGGGFANLYAPSASFISGVTSVITSTAMTSVLSAAGGSIKNYVTNILVTNGSGTGTFVDIYDGGGNVLYSGYAAASGGGFSATLPVPVVGSANKSVDVKARAQASIIAAMTGYTA